jgi:putative SOS response-associated peptidase YedK
MCGRYTLTNPDPTQLRARFRLPESLEIEDGPRYNIAPTDPVLAVRRTADGVRDAGHLRWGLLPGRWAERRSGPPLINARAESLTRQPAFSESFRERRCLLPADGFYEWRLHEGGKRPVWISRQDGDLFAFAGIWAALERKGEATPLYSCALITCEPNGLVRPIHDRMPVVLAPEHEELWLSADAEEHDLLTALAPAPEDMLRARDVADHVNDVRQEGPHLLEPPAETAKLF